MVFLSYSRFKDIQDTQICVSATVLCNQKKRPFFRLNKRKLIITEGERFEHQKNFMLNLSAKDLVDFLNLQQEAVFSDVAPSSLKAA
jgi:hypothetical protein